MKNWNSSKNQEIKRKLVNREVVHLATPMITELQEKSEELSMEIMELFYSVPDYDTAKENYIYELSDEEKEELKEDYDVDDLDDVDAEDICSDLGIETDFCEPYEFWIVSNYLGEKLKEKGEIVADFLGFIIWGRQATGQAILLDGVISRIAEDMEILEGMENEW